jgi:aldehyde dehydrogenase (NAD+)
MASPASVAVRDMSAAGQVPHYDLFIGGKWVRSSRNAPTEDFNPATGALYALVEQAGEEEARNAIAAAEEAGKTWGKSLVGERVAMLTRVAEVLEKRRGELVDVLIDEAGSLPGKGHFEVNYCIDLCQSAAGDARHIFGDTLPATQPGQFGFTLRSPASWSASRRSTSRCCCR